MGAHCGYNSVPLRQGQAGPSSSFHLGDSQRCFTQMEPSPTSLAPGKAQPTNGQSLKAISDKPPGPGSLGTLPMVGMPSGAWKWAPVPLLSLVPSC